MVHEDASPPHVRSATLLHAWTADRGSTSLSGASISPTEPPTEVSHGLHEFRTGAASGNLPYHKTQPLSCNGLGWRQ